MCARTARPGHPTRPLELPGPLSPLGIPTSLQDALMARLDRLASVKEVAQLAATIGRNFSHELLTAVSQAPGDEVDDAFLKLLEAGLIYRRGLGTEVAYEFKHALVQETAYQSLLKSKRRQYHQRIAEVLAEKYPDVVETEPELLAHHYAEAGMAPRRLSTGVTLVSARWRTRRIRKRLRTLTMRCARSTNCLPELEAASVRFPSKSLVPRPYCPQRDFRRRRRPRRMPRRVNCVKSWAIRRRSSRSCGACSTFT